MEKYQVEPILSSSVSEVVHFLRNWHANRSDSSPAQRASYQDSRRSESRLHWLLNDNPATTNDSSRGFCVRNSSGAIVGMILCFPGAFLAGDQELIGLCSGSFFVEPQARIQGFYLFKKYLNVPGYHFFFGTTCNANSGALWGKLGGAPIPNSEKECILPLKLDVMLPAFLAVKTCGRMALGVAKAIGRTGNPIWRLLTKKSSELTVQTCQDWEKLSALFQRHRPEGWITANRSPQFLQWRYGPKAPNSPAEIYMFRDKSGNEGWFALGPTVRGRQSQIRGFTLLDAVWPREKMEFRDILQASVRLVEARADALFFGPRPGIDYRECSRWIIPRRLEGPQAFAMARKGAAAFPATSLDLVPADGDSAF